MKKLSTLLVSIILFGYSQTSNAQIALETTTVSGCPGELVELCGAFSGQADPLNVDDRHTGLINLGFSFNFYGNNHTQATISDNGYLSFKPSTASQHSSYTWTGLQTSTDAFNAIHAAMVDMYLPAGGKLRYERIGSTPGSRRFVAEWCNMPLYGTNCWPLRITTQVILYEGSNIIEIHTRNIDPIVGNCPSASSGSYGKVVQGVVNPNNTQSLYTPGRDYAGNYGTIGVTNDAVRFTPNPNVPAGYTVEEIPYNPIIIIDLDNVNLLTWYKSTDLVNPIGVGDCVNAVIEEDVPYYVVKYEGEAGCHNDLMSLTDTVWVELLTFRSESNVEICSGESYEFQGQTFFMEGSYNFNFINVRGCDSTYTLNLSINPLPNVEIFGPNSYEFCEGDQVTFGVKGNESNITYQWFRNGNTISGETGGAITVNSSGVYHVVGTSNKGCVSNSGVVQVSVNPVPEVSLTNNQQEVMCTFDTISLTASSNIPVDFYWEPDYAFRNIVGNNGSTVEGVFSEGDALVTVRGVSLKGCESSAEAYVYTKHCCEVNIPTAFSPDNDGLNDFFGPILRPTQSVINFTIYDRYGNTVFNTNSTSALGLGWDGNYSDGRPAKIDSYTYILEYTCSDRQVYTTHGTVTLLR